MAAINPYLNFNGNTEQAFNFYKSVFVGEFLAVMRFKDYPECADIPESDKDRILHIALPIGNGNAIMATDEFGVQWMVNYDKNRQNAHEASLRK
jgi:PhnB protein